MSSVKNVSGDYDIYANLVTIHSDFRVIGNSSTINSTNSSLKDNIIIINDGETGAGVSLGTSGLMVDRGTLYDNAYWQFNEVTGTWEGRFQDGNLINLSSGLAVANADVITLEWMLTHPPKAQGPERAVQFNKGDYLAGNSSFEFDEANVMVNLGNLQFSADAITNTTTDLTVNSPLRMTNQGVVPTAVSDHTTIYANTPAGGGTGVYFVNTSNSDELISKKKATVLALIFS